MEDNNQPLNTWGNIVLLLVCLYWFWAVALVPHIASDPPWVFLDFANLIFHEAGHFIFIFFGDFLHVLGGSLMQLLVPIIVLVAFLREQQSFSAAFALFWLGESMSNLSYYIADARAQALPLLGGDSSGHDWTWLLIRTNLLSQDTTIGAAVHLLAILAMVAGILWMIRCIYTNLTTHYGPR